MPVEIADTEIEVTLTVQKVTPQKGWILSFFEVIDGWAGEPLSRPEQGKYETKESLF